MDYHNRTFEEAFSAWTTEIIRAEKPDTSIIAYKFGIFETPDVPSGYYLYLIGAKKYDPQDDDWAAGFGDFRPKNTYLALPEKEFKNLKWEKVEKLVEKTVKRFTKSEEFKHSFFNNAKAIAVGFDDGDLVRVK